MTVGEKPEFLANRAGERVADGLNGHLAHLRTTLVRPPDLAIATAYFNLGGYELLADELEKVGSVRLLVGAEPTPPERSVRRLATEARGPRRLAHDRLRRALEGHERVIEQDRDLLGFTFAAEAAARRLIEWLRLDRVEVRRVEDAFLHGKAFIVTSHDEGAIAGSSNLTYAGLATNIELNLGQYQPHVVRQVEEWFDDLWQRASPYDLAAVYDARFQPHPPYLIYLRMLWERYGQEIEDEARAENAPRIHLTSFQKDGLWRAKRILAQRHGVLIADEVGLGKTFLAGELMREAIEERRQRVLLVAPATLRDGPWARFFTTHQLGVERCSFEQIAADSRLNPGGSLQAFQFDPREYAMIVIDEAHNLRNPATLRAAALRRLLQGAPPKDLVLITATPVNNSLWDLYYLLGYFLKNDAAFADSGIRSLRDRFASAMAVNPDDLSPAHLFDILDSVAVRRTRPFVKHYYANDTVKIDGRERPITFPTPRVIKVSYDLDAVLPGFFRRLAHGLDSDSAAAGEYSATLSLARYIPSRYRLDGQTEAHEAQLAGLLRSGLLKRFESSAHAFARTCRKMIQSHDAFLTLLDHDKIGQGAALADWQAADSDDFDWDIGGPFEDARAYDVERLRRDVARDREILAGFADEAERVTLTDDPKLAALGDELAAIARQARAQGVSEADERDKRKVLVFSYFADSVEWITRWLEGAVRNDERLSAFANRIASVSGNGGDRETVLWGFAPRSSEAPDGRDEDLFDIVVATDVLAEGVNLQQARHIINYDLPWNPMRLVQRHGRIDRIGSPHREVFLRCVFPDAQLDQLLGLEERLHRKIKQAAASVGVGGEVLPGSRVEDVVFSEARDEIERLRAGDASIFERGTGRSALSGEEYRQELRRALENPDVRARVEALAWGSGSGMVSRDGTASYVFCARVGDHQRPQFRVVTVDAGAITGMADDILIALDAARPRDGFNTQRVLSENAHRLAYDAWDKARESILDDWNRAADPASLVAPVPATMQRAADTVRAHRPPDMTIDEADRLIDALQAPHPERVLRTIRQAMAAETEPTAQARAIARVVQELGLEASPPPKVLPEIGTEDVHLICWLALAPR